MEDIIIMVQIHNFFLHLSLFTGVLFWVIFCQFLSNYFFEILLFLKNNLFALIIFLWMYLFRRYLTNEFFSSISLRYYLLYRYFFYITLTVTVLRNTYHGPSSSILFSWYFAWMSWYNCGGHLVTKLRKLLRFSLLWTFWGIFEMFCTKFFK